MSDVGNVSLAPFPFIWAVPRLRASKTPHAMPPGTALGAGCGRQLVAGVGGSGFQAASQFNSTPARLIPAFDSRVENETVWLTPRLMAELIQTTTATINIHLGRMFG